MPFEVQPDTRRGLVKIRYWGELDELAARDATAAASALLWVVWG